MIPTTLVRARVVDITRAGSPVPHQVVIDASVLYFLYYTGFTQLRLAGGRLPHSYQLREYPRWYAGAPRHGCAFFAAVPTLGEFVRLVEYAELEALWLTAPTTPPGSRFDPQQCKRARYQFSGHLRTVRRVATTSVSVVRGDVRLLPQFPSEADALDRATAEWLDSAGDYDDSFLVASAR